MYFFLDVPSEPKNARITKVNKDCIFVAWDKPDSDGGSPITGYLIERKERNSLLWVKANDTAVRSTEYPCVGLIEGLEYTFRIYALNRAGASKPSKPTEFVTARAPVGKSNIPIICNRLLFLWSFSIYLQLFMIVSLSLRLYFHIYCDCTVSTLCGYAVNRIQHC